MRGQAQQNDHVNYSRFCSTCSHVEIVCSRTRCMDSIADMTPSYRLQRPHKNTSAVWELQHLVIFYAWFC